MSLKETGLPETKNAWFFVPFFTWAKSKGQEAMAWLSLGKEEYPNNESGELMRRYMANKSWFDKISSFWIEQPLLVKTAAVIGFGLVAGLLGLWVGASLVLTLSALAISFVAHTLLISHEQHRREGAKIFAEEGIALNTNLEANNIQLNEAKNTVTSIATEVISHCDSMKEQAKKLDSENTLIHQQNKKLEALIKEVEESTGSLLEKEKSVQKGFEGMSVDLQQCDRAIKQTTRKVEGLGDAVSKFSDAVESIVKSQEIISERANRLCFFANEQVKEVQDKKIDEDRFLDALRRQNDEAEMVIEQMKLAMASKGMQR